MSRVSLHLAALVAGLATALCANADRLREPITVCTITVNSSDEGEAMRHALPPARYRFVELVERGRPDWLATACRSGVRCDVLLVSGHFDGSSVFFSDRVDTAEHLPVAEMERVSCSDSCPGLFGSLREVYLFGCDTLNAEGNPLPRSGAWSPDGSRRHGPLAASLLPESSRDRMRRIFRDVPVIYGFPGPAPLGPASASLLGRYLSAGGVAELGTGRVSRRLLGQFSAQGMVAARGVRDTDPEATQRALVCRFEDDRVASADKLAFVHRMLGGDPALTLRYLSHIEAHLPPLKEASRNSDPTARALEDIADDRAAKARALETIGRVDWLGLRARLIAIAADVGWLSQQEKRDALADLFADKLARDSLDATDVDLACRLNAHGDLDTAHQRLAPMAASTRGAASLLACLGDAKSRQLAIAALSGGHAKDAELAKVYLHYRPVDSAEEFRALAQAIVDMSEPESQARALEALARHGESDEDGVAALASLYATTRSGVVQRAVAGVLIRAKVAPSRGAALASTVRAHRIGPPGQSDIIDALLRRLASA